MNASAKRHGAVNTSSRNNDICAGGQCCGNRKGANVSIRARYLFFRRECVTREHLRGVHGLKTIEIIEEIVARDDNHLQVQSGLRNNRSQCVATRLWIYAAGVTDQFNARAGNTFQIRFNDSGDEIGCVSQLRI